MKRVLGIVMLAILTFTSVWVYANEGAPKFTKRNVSIFYDVPDQVIMCQNKAEDMGKGADEFEKTLQKYYGKRFNVLAVQRIHIDENADKRTRDTEKKRLFENEQGAQPIFVKIELVGNSTATDTYQNVFGAQQSITVPTTTIFYLEGIGDKERGDFWSRNTQDDYRPGTLALFGQLWIMEKDTRTLTKHSVEGAIKTMNSFTPPNKYTHPDEYELYLAYYIGDAGKIANIYNKK